MGRGAVILGLLLLPPLLPLAGCLDGAGPRTDSDVQASGVVVNGVCPSGLATSVVCSVDDEIRISGAVHLEEVGPAVYVVADRDVLLHNLSVRGATTGVVVSVRPTCDCNVTLSNVTLDGVATGLDPETDAYYLGHGVLVERPLNMAGDGEAQLFMDRVAVAGFDVGLFTLEVSHIAGAGVRLWNGLVGAEAVSARSVTLADCSFIGFAQVGLVTDEEDVVKVERCTFGFNGVGHSIAHSGLTTEVTIAGSEYVSNGLALSVGNSRVEITDSAFAGNGAPNQTVAGGGDGGAIRAFAPSFNTASPVAPAVIVRGSSFEANQAFAVEDTAPSIWVDAIGNWWGSPLGPSLRPVPGMAGGLGDAIDPTVAYLPFLTAPP